MSEFDTKGIYDFMIHVFNNLPEEFDVILNGLENYLTGPDKMTIEVICDK